MQDRYDASQVEAKWRKTWADAKLYDAIVMFPYPSGDKLHVGHWYNYAPADSHARFMRMHGKTVFSPMGFDAFGLPAENYAIKTGVKPAESIKKNVETMIEQLSKIGCMYDWTKMVNTTDPS
jgi:leucyl-tRNA synthetase